MTVGERIKKRRTELGLSAEDVAIKIGKDRATVYRYESNNVEKLPITILEPLAEVLNTTPSYLMGWNEENPITTIQYPSNIRPIKTKRFPMLGEIACGKPIWAEEDHESYIDASADIKADFCLTARGDSMIGARIHDGDVIFIRKQSIVDNGEIAAVIIDNEATLKRWYYYPKEKKLVLNAENSAYAPLVYIGVELETVTCLGKAVCFMSNL